MRLAKVVGWITRNTKYLAWDEATLEQARVVSSRAYASASSRSRAAGAT